MRGTRESGERKRVEAWPARWQSCPRKAGLHQRGTGQRRDDEIALWLVCGGWRGGAGGQGPVRRLLQSSGRGEGAGWRAGQQAGQAGGGSLWRLLRGGPEPGPRVWRAQS